MDKNKIVFAFFVSLFLISIFSLFNSILNAQAQNIPICIAPGGFPSYVNYWVLSGNNLSPSSTSWNVQIQNLKFGVVDTNNGYEYIKLINSAGTYIGGLMYASSNSSYGYNSLTIYTRDNRNIILQPFGGKVGIGTANPQAKLDVRGPLRLYNESPNGIIGSLHLEGKNPSSSNPYSTRWSIYNMRDYSGINGLTIYEYYDSNNNGTFCESGEVCSARFIISNGGNVGIGTTNPQAKLEVVGAIRLAPSSQPSNPQEGMMYYDRNQGKFKCYVKGATGLIEQDCGGGGEPLSFDLTVPVKIYDTSKTRIVLEISEE